MHFLLHFTLPKMTLQKLLSCNITIVTILTLTPLILIQVNSLDPRYEACWPRSCGGLTISYPFYNSNDETDFICGYKGFGMRCVDDKPIYRKSLAQYIIKSISYDDQSFHVVDLLVVGSSCPKPTLNCSFHRPMDFGPRHANLAFFYGCDKSSPLVDLRTFSQVSCDGNTSYMSFVGLFVDKQDLPNTTLCKTFVAAPVELEEWQMNSTIKDVDYAGLLQAGFTLRWTGLYNCQQCRRSGGRCGHAHDNGNGTSVCFCPDQARAIDCHEGSAAMPPLELTMIILATGLLLMAVLLIFYCTRKRCWLQGRNMLTKKEKENIESLVRSHGSIFPRRYRYHELKKLTNSFSEKLGEGGYGKVYKGKLQENGRFVAVKILKDSEGNGEVFMSEVASISRTAHVNIVELVGFCYEGNKRALLYDYMSNGSLDKFLPLPTNGSQNCSLKWKTLHQIALGIARGLEYLHRGCNTRILHFDIKPQNILLDHDFTPKISDFGLAKLCQGRESIVSSMLGARGTIGYIAPELVSRYIGSVSHKSDVYSYGMLLFEIVGGKNSSVVEASSQSSEMYFPEWVYNHLEMGRALWMPGIDSDEDDEIARKMLLVSLWCIQTIPSDRPSMSRVIEMLEGSIKLIGVPPKPFSYSPPTRASNGCQTTPSSVSSSLKFEEKAREGKSQEV